MAQDKVTVTETSATANGTSWHLGSPVATALIGTSPLLSAGLMQILSNTCFVVSEEVFDNPASFSRLPTAEPALFLLDANHCSSRIAEDISPLKAAHPTAQVVVITDHFEIRSAISAYEAGADGFCLTTAGRDVLIGSLELLMLGGGNLPSVMARSMIEQISCCRERPLETAPSTQKTGAEGRKAHNLSLRESEVLDCLMQGAPNKVIAWKFGLTEATVKVHLKAIFRKIDAKNRTQAAMWATSHSFDAASVKPHPDVP
jgi:two-component system, NarL family, nitrate/nitrite response regulator NarL